MGCGCSKKVAGSAAQVAANRRVTIYEVQVANETVAEFESLPAARAEAVKVGGRVKVSSKVVTG